MGPERRYTTTQAEAVLARAIELDAAVERDGFTADQLFAIGEEMGLSRSAIAASLREAGAEPARENGLLDRIMGPARVVVERPTRRPAAAAAADLYRRLERLNLRPAGPGDRVWVQRLDWWPDAHRISAPVVLQVNPLPSSASRPALLRVDARVDEARRNHIAGAFAGAALLPLAIVGVPAALLAATAVGAVLGAIGSYRLRVRAVEQRIVRMLDTVATPTA